MIGDSNDKTNFLHKLLLTDRQVSKLRKAFVHVPSARIKLSKTHISCNEEDFLADFLNHYQKSVYH